MPFCKRALCLALLLALGSSLTAQTPVAPTAATSDVLKATLHNGLRVVIVRSAIAPVVSTDMTYLVGSRDDPSGVPGMAHAQEHMMFRGTKQSLDQRARHDRHGARRRLQRGDERYADAVPIHRSGRQPRRRAADRGRPDARRARFAVAVAERARRDRARSAARRVTTRRRFLLASPCAGVCRNAVRT